MYTWLPLGRISFVAISALVFFAYNSVSSDQQPTPTESALQYIVHDEPALVSAKAYAVFDVETGKILAVRNLAQVLPIASVTKLMTAEALLKNQDLAKTSQVKYEDVETEGRSGKLQVGEDYSYHELLFPLLLESSNDAAAFFVRITGGEVISDMNLLAKSIGMNQTKFVDASGLTDKNVSSVADLVIFLQYLVKENSHILDITRLKQYIGPYSGWVNNNPVIDDAYRGGKHGYTLEAKRTLVALFEENFNHSSRKIGYILLGSDNLMEDIAILRNFTQQSVTFE